MGPTTHTDAEAPVPLAPYRHVITVTGPAEPLDRWLDALETTLGEYSPSAVWADECDSERMAVYVLDLPWDPVARSGAVERVPAFAQALHRRHGLHITVLSEWDWVPGPVWLRVTGPDGVRTREMVVVPDEEMRDRIVSESDSLEIATILVDDSYDAPGTALALIAAHAEQLPEAAEILRAWECDDQRVQAWLTEHAAAGPSR